MPVKSPQENNSVAGLSDLILMLQDVAPLPARHEMVRWLVATQVIKLTSSLIPTPPRTMLRRQKQCSGHLPPGGGRQVLTGLSGGGHQLYSGIIILGGLLALMEKDAPFGLFL